MATNISRVWRGDHEPCADHLVWPAAAHGAFVSVADRARLALQGARRETLKDGIYLVPVRAFIGIGWLRAFAEKVLDSGWRDGARLAAFLERQLDAGAIAIPPYQTLVTDLFLSHALVLGWIVMLGQLLAGLAIASGSLTTAALLGGIFMNLNFVLAGAPDPSAFYIVIQMVLLLAGTGAVLGFDALLGRYLPFLTARPADFAAPRPLAPPVALALAALAAGCGTFATLHIRDWTPKGSVHDPAAVLAVLAFMAAAWALIAALRGGQQPATERTAS
jgi:hypothetical protein